MNNTEFVLKKELGIKMVDGQEFMQVEKYHFQSAWECDKKYNQLKDGSFKILMRKGTEWSEITPNELYWFADKVKNRLFRKIKKRG